MSKSETNGIQDISKYLEDDLHNLIDKECSFFAGSDSTWWTREELEQLLIKGTVVGVIRAPTGEWMLAVRFTDSLVVSLVEPSQLVKTDMNKNEQTVLASEVERGQCFRKVNGKYVYLSISKASAEFMGLDSTKLHGVCFNGNMVSVALDKKVIIMPLQAIVENQLEQDAWEDSIGVKRHKER